MKIVEIYIEGFGRLEHFSMQPSDGLNVVFGDNESGKTTLMSFIRAMLYGVGNKNDLREKYRPRSGGAMGGNLVFEHNGVNYRLERTFLATAARDITTLWNTDTGEKLALPAKTTPGEYVLGISQGTFENTLFINHNACALGKNCDDIVARLNNIVSTGEESFSYAEVSTRLKNAEKRFNSRANNAIIPMRLKQIEEANEEKEQIENKAFKLKEEIANSDSAQKQLDGIEEEIKKLSLLERKAAALAEMSELAEIIESYKRANNAKDQFQSISKAVSTGEGLLDMPTLRKQRALYHDISLVKGECALLEQTVASQQKQLEDARLKQEKYKSITDRVQELEELKQYDKEPVHMPVYPFVIGALAVVAVGVGLSFVSTWAMIVGILLCIVVVAAIVLLMSKNIKRSNEPVFKLTELLRSCGCSSVQDFYTKLEESKSNAAECEKIETILKQSREKAADKAREVQNLENNVQEFLANFEVCTALPIDDAFDVLEQNVEQCLALQQSYNIYKEECARTLAGVSIDEVEKKLAETQQNIEQLGRVDAENTPDFYRKQIAALGEQKSKLAADIALRSHRTQQLEELLVKQNDLWAKISQLEEKLNGEEEIYRSLCIASECLDEAFSEMQKYFSPLVNNSAGEYLGKLTKGKYSSVMVSRSLEPSVLSSEDNKTHLVPDFSAGTADQIYLALRLAVSDVIFEGQRFPIFLDDSLNQYDQKRMEMAMGCLASLGTQCFLFTCGATEAEFAQKAGATLYNM